MKLVIVGATGNVGTALLRRLRESGSHEITGVARRIPPADPPYDIDHWSSIDIAEPGSVRALAQAFAGAAAVINLAWNFQPARDVARLEAVGVGGLRHVLTAVLEANVPHLVHMSSVGAYAPGRYGVPVDESWATTGVPTSPYSRHKAAAERVLDQAEVDHPDLVIARVRPGLIMNGLAASSQLRYATPALFPAHAVGWLPVLPLDRKFVVPVIHVDDVASAYDAVLQQRARGPFNLQSDDPLTRDLLAAALSAKPVHLPAGALRGLLAVAYRLRLSRLDPSWLDLGFAAPLLDTTRARTELGWSPVVSTLDAIREVIEGARRGVGGSSPVLRPRSPWRELLDLGRSGPATTRHET